MDDGRADAGGFGGLRRRGKDTRTTSSPCASTEGRSLDKDGLTKPATSSGSQGPRSLWHRQMAAPRLGDKEGWVQLGLMKGVVASHTREGEEQCQ
jgi:hypothetical protein